MSKMISTAFKYFFSGYSQYTVFTTKKQAKEYLKNNSIIHRIKDLQEMTIRDWETISAHPRNQVFEIIDNVAVPMEIEINEADEEAALGFPNCPNCADQASIAAPGQTTLCKTHDDERHYKLMKDFFIEEIQQLHFKPNSPFCSCCGTEKKVCYTGIIPVYKTNQVATFSFCIDCRDELTLKKNAVIAAQERIGA